MDAIIDSVYGLKYTEEHLKKYEEMQKKIEQIKKEMGDKYILHPKYKRKFLWK